MYNMGCAWHAQVFGVAANPAVIARPLTDEQPSQRQDPQMEVISKPKKPKKYAQ